MRLSKTWFGAIGAGTGAVIGAMAWRAITFEYGWVGAAIGAVAGVYIGYWLYGKTAKPNSP